MTKAEARRVRAARKKMGGWIGHWMAPLYGKGGCEGQAEGMPDVVLAPNVDQAFKLARCQWPTADGWVCHGVQDPRNPDCCIS